MSEGSKQHSGRDPQPGVKLRSPLVQALQLCAVAELVFVPGVTLITWLKDGHLDLDFALQGFVLIFFLCLLGGWLGAAEFNRWWLRLYPEALVVAERLNLEIDSSSGLLQSPRMYGTFNGHECEMVFIKARRSVGLNLEVVFDKAKSTERRIAIGVSRTPATSELIVKALERSLGTMPSSPAAQLPPPNSL